jgi:hypothetical protein
MRDIKTLDRARGFWKAECSLEGFSRKTGATHGQLQIPSDQIQETHLSTPAGNR